MDVVRVSPEPKLDRLTFNASNASKLLFLLKHFESLVLIDLKYPFTSIGDAVSVAAYGSHVGKSVFVRRKSRKNRVPHLVLH